MKLETFKTFIRRYYLEGIISKTKLRYAVIDKTLHARACADNKAFVADVVMNDCNDLGVDDVVLCIGDTEKIVKMLSPFGEDINLSINKSGDRILGLVISDNDCESYMTMADPSAMDPAPKNLADIKDFSVEIPLTDEFLDKFLKARNALKDVLDFTVAMNKKGLFEIVIGYATANSNRIRITPTTDAVMNKIDAPLSFPIKNIAAAFKANSDIVGGTFSINNMGIARIYFKNDKYTATYYQFANKNK